MKAALIRIQSMILRYCYLIRGSWPRMLEMMYWPAMNVLLWGMINGHFSQIANQTSGYIFTTLLGAAMLWDVLFRAQMGVSLSFLEELWSCNLAQLFISPLHPREWLISLAFISLIRSLVSLFPAIILAWLVYDYHFWSIGWGLTVFMLNMMLMGWWLGLLSMALILRYGMGAESVAWMLVVLLAPLSAIYYPFSAIPYWLQPVAALLPSPWIFENLRHVLAGQPIDSMLLLRATGLNIFYLFAGVLVFFRGFNGARIRGSLLQQGE
ncbi:MAG: ABC transporter permease [Alphaproteobacteria bacterium]